MGSHLVVLLIFSALVAGVFAMLLREEGDLLVVELQANAFLHHMVRNIMGALLQIGQGRESVDWMAQLLSWRDRRRGAPTFSPDGLYLSAIDYPDEFGLDELDGGALLLSPFTRPSGNPP